MEDDPRRACCRSRKLRPDGESVSEVSNIEHGFRPYRHESRYEGFSFVYARTPRLSRSEAPSISASHSIDIAFLGHERSVISRSGRPSETRRIDRLHGGLHAGEEIAFLEVQEDSEYVEIVPGKDLRHDIAEALRIPRAAELAELPNISDPALLAAGMRIRSHATGGDRLEDSAAEELVITTLAGLMRRHLGGRLPSRGNTPLRHVLQGRRLARITDYLETHLARPISLDELATTAALSKFHFLRAFKATFGITPTAYMQARRMEEARRALLEGRTKPSAIPENVGYKPGAHFQKLFKRHHGVSPARYLDAVRS